MSGSLSRGDIIADIEAAFDADSRELFGEGGYSRALDQALLDFQRYKPRIVLGSLSLVADQALYAPPALLVRPRYGLWGSDERRARKRWESNFKNVERLPALSLIETDQGLQLHLDPSPTAEQIVDLGAAYAFYYEATHVVDDLASKTTVKAEHRGLLILRACAELARELALRNANKPVSLADGVSQGPRNATPAALYDQLLREFKEAAR